MSITTLLSLLLIFVTARAQMVPFGFLKAPAATAPVDCVNGSPVMGNACIGGGIYAGTYNYGGGTGVKKLMVTPGGCTNSATPTCAGTTDSLMKAWGTFNITTNTVSADDGYANSSVLGSGSPDAAADAAKYCWNMTYAGFTDWYLPATNELAILYTNRGAIGGFNLSTTGYWTSTEASAFSGFMQKFSDGTQLGNAKTMTVYVRCIRRF